MTMQAGILDRRIQLLRAAVVDDGLQVRRGEYAALGPEVWASRRDVSDSERFAAGADRAAVETRWRLRWSPLSADVSTGDRLSCEGRLHEIVGVKEVGRRQLIEISTRGAGQ